MPSTAWSPQSAEVARRPQLGHVPACGPRPSSPTARRSPPTTSSSRFDILKEKGHPIYRVHAAAMCRRPRRSTRTPCATPSPARRSRDLPLIVAGLPILSKAYYATHEFDQTTLEPPLGSGPYKIGDFKHGTFVSYKRRDDYWAKDLPVNRGRFNFDELRYEYYRDRTAAAREPQGRRLRPARGVHLRRLGHRLRHPRRQGGPARPARRCPTRARPARRASSSTRAAPSFADLRVRKALDYAFDFEWTNKNIFYGLYKRTESFFENSDMKADGQAEPGRAGAARAVPRPSCRPRCSSEPYTPPVSDGSGQDRKLLREAARLLDEAGWTGQGRQARQRQGRGARARVPDRRSGLPSASSRPTSRTCRPSASRRRSAASTRRSTSAASSRSTSTSSRTRYALRLTPGVELQSFWGSEAAKTDGSFNLAGISDPVVDALIDKVIEAKSRDELSDGDAGARPRAARRPLLGAAMVQGGPPRRLLGQVRPARRETALRARHYRTPGGTMPTKRQN